MTLLNATLPARDSLIWWLAVAAAAFGYLATMPPPTDWSYSQWISTGAAACLYLIGKLQHSPLSSVQNREDAEDAEDAADGGRG